jgi:hypothetical protein
MTPETVAETVFWGVVLFMVIYWALGKIMGRRRP